MAGCRVLWELLADADLMTATELRIASALGVP
jgi:hypothetical protein